MTSALAWNENMKKKNIIISAILALICALSLLIYCFLVGITEEENYNRYSIKYYLRTPIPIRDVTAAMAGHKGRYRSVLGDGPAPAADTVTFDDVKDIEAAIKSCENALAKYPILILTEANKDTVDTSIRLEAEFKIEKRPNNKNILSVTLYNYGPIQ